MDNDRQNKIVIRLGCVIAAAMSKTPSQHVPTRAQEYYDWIMKEEDDATTQSQEGA